MKSLLLNIEQITPFTDTTARYEHFHVPCGLFISSPKTSGRIKTAFCQAWLDKTAEIMEQKPDDLPFCKVVAMIDAGDLWESQIIIFYDKDYYDSFWLRDTAEQTWLPIDAKEKSFVKDRNIETAQKEKGYIEILSDDGVNRKSALWFYGDICQEP